MKTVLAAAALASFTAWSALAAAPASPRDDALRWVGLVDLGRYDESWSDAGAIFKSRITPAAWASAVAPVRGPLGTVVARKPLSEADSTSLPGAPDGRYKIIRFDTEFTHKRVAVETVVLGQEAEGWKVDGYFIR